MSVEHGVDRGLLKALGQDRLDNDTYFAMVWCCRRYFVDVLE